MKTNSTLFLVGYMGSGKSTVGKMLSGLLNYSFIDLDTAIELETGKTISEIFETEGESGFRKIEQSVLHGINARKNHVVATGGGCPMFEDNMDWMNKNGTTIYLKVHPGIIFHRIAPEKPGRPLIAALSDVELMDFILETIKKRLPFYIKAHHTISAEETPKAIARSIQIQLQD